MTSGDHRRIPHDPTAEAHLIGSMLLGPTAITEAIAAGVAPHDFYNPALAETYAAILELHAAGQPVDQTTVGAHLDAPPPMRRLIQDALMTTPASDHAAGYATIIRQLARRRAIITTATELANHAYNDTDPANTIHELGIITTPPDTLTSRLADGGSFTFDTDETMTAIWGHDDRILWAAGELLMLVGPPGVGKTTIMAQLVAGRLGLQPKLLDLEISEARRILYLACDRPRQIRRAFRRIFHEHDRQLLDERLVVWQGPPPQDFATHQRTLTELAMRAGADTVFIDSLKDVAIGITDDVVGAGLNSCIQHALAEGIDIAASHHQRKGQQGTKPKSLEDVYGSTWVTAGAGSVVLLWGAAGDSVVELHHLKQPSEAIGPLKVAHDHNSGHTTISHGIVDVLALLRSHPHGMTSKDLAQETTGTLEPDDNSTRIARRRLDRLVTKHLAHKIVGQRGGIGGTKADRYYAATPEELALRTPNEPTEPSPDERF